MASTTWLGIADPFFLARRALRQTISAISSVPDGRTLDIGCGIQPYRDLFKTPDYFGVEVKTASRFGSSKRANAYFDGLLLPFADNTFGLVLCTQVLEHVFEPDKFLIEMRRVLIPGGHLLITTPFIWDEHEQPFDFGRYSSFGLRHLAEQHGFIVEHSEKTLGDASAIVQLCLAYWFKVMRRLPAPLAKSLVAVLSLPLNILGLLAAELLPANPDLYIDNVMLWRKPVTVSAGDHSCP